MHQVTQLQTEVETMLRDGFPEVEVLLVDKPTPNRFARFVGILGPGPSTDEIMEWTRGD